jgi:hypothetical protein
VPCSHITPGSSQAATGVPGVTQATIAAITELQQAVGVMEISLLNFVVSDGSNLIATRFVSAEDARCRANRPAPCKLIAPAERQEAARAQRAARKQGIVLRSFALCVLEFMAPSLPPTLCCTLH